MKGTYCLIISLKKSDKIKIGHLYQEPYKFKKGYYVYIGSAMNSLIPRLKRHLSDDKKMHWHIDYLLKNEYSDIREILFTDSEKIIECELASRIAKEGLEIESFGCSDCNCNSHLIYFDRKGDALKSVKDAYKTLNIKYLDLKYFRKINEN
ncbi:MAG: GIY-YIG nuclease family protein [Methanobrevibacter sp.]|nr:GIY-YIG nuclease family protein [Methanobrevibacter sp.]